MAYKAIMEIIVKRKVYLLLLILAIGFLANLIWENAQAFMYEGYTDFLSHFLVCFIATIVDALVILLMYLLFAAAYKDIYWMKCWNGKNISILLLIGGTLAVGFEKWALVKAEWRYNELMPIVPLLDIGFSPLLQLMILPFITYYFSYLILKSNKSIIEK